MSGETSYVSLFEYAGLALAPILPLLLAVALLPRGWRGLVVRFAPWATLPALAVAVFSSGKHLDLPWVLLGVRLGTDETGQVFLIFTAVLWLLTGVYARCYLAEDSRRVRFFAFYLLTMSGNLGLIVAQDVLSFYLFFALMSFAAYGLIVHNRDPRALRAGRVYMCLAVLAEVLLFAGLVEGTWNAGTISLERFAETAHSHLVIGLLLLGFGIKAGALPLHFWLPVAHAAAPTPASAVLSGAMVNAGLLGWLRFLPLGAVNLPEWGALLIVAGLSAAVYGLIVGLLQGGPKTVLAYSTVSQMGLMTVAVGVGLVAPEIWPLCLSAILIYAFHHAFAKGALFLGAGVAAAAGSGTTSRCLVVTGLLIPALALAGLPFTSGAVAKSALMSLITVLPEPWPHWMAAVLSLIAVGTTLLMMRFLYLAWPRGYRRAGIIGGLLLPWTILLALVVCSTWLWPMADEALQRTLSAVEFWHASWPIGVGAISAWVVWVLSDKAIIKLHVRIPAGDILFVAQCLSNWIGGVWSFLADRFRQKVASHASSWWRSVTGLASFDANRLMAIELRRWDVGGVIFLTALVLVFLGFALA